VAWRTFARNRLALLGLAIVVALVLVAIFADVLAPYSPYVGDLRTTRLLAAIGAHWFGTDDQGRDIFSRVLVGSRITLTVVIGGGTGRAHRPAGGHRGGLCRRLGRCGADAGHRHLPGIPPADPGAGFRRCPGAGHRERGDAIAITSWPPYARIARAETLQIRQADYIAAVQLIGASPWRIVLRHIMPLCVSSVIVRVTLDMAGIILTAAGLGFLGLGAQPPMPEWGALIANGRMYVLDQWWVAAAPGAAIFIVSLAFNLLGDGLRDALDPKSTK
jgi:peptide/nickel transport system permease protein